jgi:hypothetical protein
MEIGKFLIKQGLKAKGLLNKIILAEIDVEEDSIIISINGEKGKELKYSEEKDNPLWQSFIEKVKKEIKYKELLFFIFEINSIDKIEIVSIVYFINEQGEKTSYTKKI